MSSSLVPPALNPSTLYKDEAKRDATRIRIYNNVLATIYNKIKAIARIPGNEKALWYIVPEFIPGVPRFDAGDAIIYIVWNLRNTGYTVEYTHPNLLYITWKSYDEKYRETESPWSQVLQTAKKANNDYNPSIIPLKQSIHIEKPKLSLSIDAKPIEISKRKSILKKTSDFHPNLSINEKPVGQTNSVYSSLYTNTQPKPTTNKLPGQLDEKHISFV